MALYNGTSSDDGQSSSVTSFWVGVMSAIIGSMILAVGMNVQRLAHMRMEERGDTKNFLFDRTWQLGITIFVVGNFGDAVALAFAPQSVVTPLGSFSLVANLFAAKFLLKEELSMQVGIGSAIIIAGVVAIVLPSSNGVPEREDEDLDTLLHRWGRPQFYIFAILHGCTAIALLGFVTHLERQMYAAAKQHRSTANMTARANPAGSEVAVAVASPAAAQPSPRRRRPNQPSPSGLLPVAQQLPSRQRCGSHRTM